MSDAPTGAKAELLDREDTESLTVFLLMMPLGEEHFCSISCGSLGCRVCIGLQCILVAMVQVHKSQLLCNSRRALQDSTMEYLGLTSLKQ